MMSHRSQRPAPHCALALRLALRLAVPALAVCMLSFGCVTHIPASNRPATIGKELIDLDRAHKDGLVSDDEYASMRAEALRNFERIGETPVYPSFPYRGGGSK